MQAVAEVASPTSRPTKHGPARSGKILDEARAQIVRGAEHFPSRGERLIQVVRSEGWFVGRHAPDALAPGPQIPTLLDSAQPWVRSRPCSLIVDSAPLRCCVNVRHGRGVAQNLRVERTVSPDRRCARCVRPSRSHWTAAPPASRGCAPGGISPVSSTTTRSNELLWPAVRSLDRISRLPVLDTTRPGYGARTNFKSARPDAFAIASICARSSAAFPIGTDATAARQPAWTQRPYQEAKRQNCADRRLRVLAGNAQGGLVCRPPGAQEVHRERGKLHRLAGERMAGRNLEHGPAPLRELANWIGRHREGEHRGRAPPVTLRARAGRRFLSRAASRSAVRSRYGIHPPVTPGSRP